MEMTQEKLTSIQLEVLDVCRNNGLEVDEMLSLLTLMISKSIKAMSLDDMKFRADLTKATIECILGIVTRD